MRGSNSEATILSRQGDVLGASVVRVTIETGTRMIRRLVFLLLIAVNAACRCDLPPESHELATVTNAVWTVNLHSNGYSSDDYKVHSANRAMRQIAFGSANEVVVINDGDVCGKSNPVHAFVLDSRSGRLVGEANWMSNCWPYIFASAGGNYVAVTSDGMSVYSPGLKAIRAKLPEAAAEMISSDGRVVAAWKSIPGHGLTYFLDADTLRSTGHEFLDKNAVSVSQDTIAYLATRSGSTNQVLFLDDGTTRARAIETECGLIHARFLSPDVLAILGCDSVRVVSRKGEDVFSLVGLGQIGDTEISAVARDGSRFAISRIFHTSGDIERICGERIVVFDLRARRAVFAIDLTNLRGLTAHAHASGIALSPDGTQLAVDSEGIVQAFGLPKS
jgi:hypothetical protein